MALCIVNVDNLEKCFKQRGAAEARRAHNPEDTGSKPVVAIFLLLLFFPWRVIQVSQNTMRDTIIAATML